MGGEKAWFPLRMQAHNYFQVYAILLADVVFITPGTRLQYCRDITEHG